MELEDLMLEHSRTKVNLRCICGQKSGEEVTDDNGECALTKAQWDSYFVGLDIPTQQAIDNAEFVYQRLRQVIGRVTQAPWTDTELVSLELLLGTGISQNFASAALRATKGLDGN